jgi:hypothetical protein
MLRLYRHFDAQFRGEDANGNVTPDKPSRNLKLVCSCCQHKVGWPTKSGTHRKRSPNPESSTWLMQHIYILRVRCRPVFANRPSRYSRFTVNSPLHSGIFTRQQLAVSE